eukprot:gb/GECH01006804.1/.p1 GENE.gb/GECH01006804.1/~~gb/GECH01006804.1/.p1  ORF type:complete len:164 (+),score=15.51 gb/GECH01006804.1/:1-492(+)
MRLSLLKTHLFFLSISFHIIFYISKRYFNIYHTATIIITVRSSHSYPIYPFEVLLLVPPQSILTYLLYINSMLQAVTLFYLAVQYDGYTRLISEFDGMLFRMLPSRYVPFSHPTSEHDDSDRPDEGDDGRRDSEKSHGGDNDDDRNHKYVHRSKRKQTIEERV